MDNEFDLHEWDARNFSEYQDLKGENKEKSAKDDGILSGAEFHVAVVFLVAVINVMLSILHLGPYNDIVWSMLFDGNRLYQILTIILIPLILIELYDTISWKLWKISGVVLIALMTALTMKNLETFDTPYFLFLEAGTLMASIFCISLIPDKTGFADALIAKYVDKEFETKYSYDRQIMEMNKYYGDGLGAIAVFRDQVRIMLNYELTEADVKNVLKRSGGANTFLDSKNKSLSSFDLDNPKFNPLHSSNRKESSYNSEMSPVLKYAYEGLMDEFAKDCRLAKEGRLEETNNGLKYPADEMEMMIRSSIATLKEKELLVVYSVIALYKNTPAYRNFSRDVARVFAANYIQSGIYESYDDFFVDLLMCISEYGIIEDEEGGDEDA